MRKSLIFQMKREYEKISEPCWVAPEDINTSHLPCLVSSFLTVYPSDRSLQPPFKAEYVTSLLPGDSWLLSCPVPLASLLVQVHALPLGKARFFNRKRMLG